MLILKTLVNHVGFWSHDSPRLRANACRAATSDAGAQLTQQKKNYQTQTFSYGFFGCVNGSIMRQVGEMIESGGNGRRRDWGSMRRAE